MSWSQDEDRNGSMKLFIAWVKRPLAVQYLLWILLLSVLMAWVYWMYHARPHLWIFKILHYVIYAGIGFALYQWTYFFRQQHPQCKPILLYVGNSFMVILLLGFTYWMKNYS